MEKNAPGPDARRNEPGSGGPEDQSAKHTPVPRRPRERPTPEARRLQGALEPTRALLVGGQVVVLVAWTVLVLSWWGGERRWVATFVVAAITLALSTGGWYLQRRPLVVRSWVSGIVLGGMCLACVIWLDPMTLLAVAVASSALVAAWYLPRGREQVRGWLCQSFFWIAIGQVWVDVPMASTLAWCWMLLLVFLWMESNAHEAIRDYRRAGGVDDELYGTSHPENRWHLTPALLVAALILAAAAISLGSVLYVISSAPRHDSYSIDIGGGP